MLLGMMLVLSTACGGGEVAAVGGPSPVPVPVPGDIIGVAADNATVPFGYSPPASVTLAATVIGTGVTNTAVAWELGAGLEGCGPLGASVTQDGVFTAPTSPDTYIGGSCLVIAKAAADPTKTAVSTVTITAPPAGPPAGVVPAFLGAEGGGALTKGGRGGVVYQVTNLNDSGAGSLRACVEASGPRTCVFRVGGVINLSHGFSVTSPYLTVAGQTAPGDGIALNLATHEGGAVSGNSRIFDIWTHDVVVRYLRLWGDYTLDANLSNVGVIGVMGWGGTYNVVVDHCSILWTSWDAASVWGHNTAKTGWVTFQWNLIGETVMSSSGAAPQAIGTLTANSNYDGTQLKDVDFHHNVYATTPHRNPALNGSGRMVNNLVYNWHRASYVDSGGGTSTYDFIGNHFKPGPFARSANTMEIMLNRNMSSVYVAGNRSDVTTSPGPPTARGAVTGSESDATQWSLLTGYSPNYQGTYATTGGSQPAPSAWRRTSPLASPGVAITVDPVAGLQSQLSAAGGAGMSRRLDCNGNWVNVSDSARNRILAYVAAGGGPSDVQSSAAAYYGAALPTLSPGTSCPDADSDGIPDAYELAACGTATCLDALVVQSDGFTNLERYLNGR